MIHQPPAPAFFIADAGVIGRLAAAGHDEFSGQRHHTLKIWA
jgi:hypothetical protein